MYLKAKKNKRKPQFLGSETSILGSETSFLGSGRLKNNGSDPYLRSPLRRASGVPVVSIFDHFCEQEKNKVFKYMSETEGFENKHILSPS